MPHTLYMHNKCTVQLCTKCKTCMFKVIYALCNVIVMYAVFMFSKLYTFYYCPIYLLHAVIGSCTLFEALAILK